VWLFGIGATVLGNILHIFALDKGPLSLVEPLMVCALRHSSTAPVSRRFCR
jgi:hypothetical protein